MLSKYFISFFIRKKLIISDCKVVRNSFLNKLVHSALKALGGICGVIEKHLSEKVILKKGAPCKIDVILLKW